MEEGSGRRAASHADKNEEEEEADELCDSEALFDDELRAERALKGGEMRKAEMEGLTSLVSLLTWEVSARRSRSTSVWCFSRSTSIWRRSWSCLCLWKQRGKLLEEAG